MQIMYEKLVDPTTDITTTIAALLDGSLGVLGGDQREGLKRIYYAANSLHALFTELIQSIGIDNIIRRPHLRERFEVALRTIHHNSLDLLTEMDGPLTAEQNIAIEFLYDTEKILRSHLDAIWLYSELKYERLNIQQQRFYLADVMQQLALPPAEPAIGFRLSHTARLPALVGDAYWTRFILHTLLLNAVQATREGSIAVHAQTRGIWLDVRVSDPGQGIAAHHQTRIFEPFYQITDNPERLGLGLTIADMLTRAQQGTLHCESIPNIGSTFTLSLPLAPV